MSAGYHKVQFRIAALVPAPLFFLTVALGAQAMPASSITDFLTCQSAKMDAPHDWHIPKAVFRTDDDKFFAWAQFTDISGVHPVEMRVYRPDGTFYGKETQTINETNGVADWWRMAAWWRIKGDKPAQTPGRWRMELFVDDVLQRGAYFNINPATATRPDPVPPNAANPVVSARALLQPAPDEQQGPAWVLQTSPDLAHWTPFQTNPLPANFPGLTVPNAYLRLTLPAGAVGCFIVEASPDLLDWTPIQTNNLASLPGFDTNGVLIGPSRFFRAVIPSP